MVKKKIGYLGPEGTYTQEMTLKLFPNEELIAYPRIENVLQGVAEGEVDQGVVPIENSTEGAVFITTDVLAHEVDLKILEECILPIDHYLWVRPGQKKVSRILSHPQALGQCRKFLRKHYPDAEILPVNSSGEGGEKVLTDENTAAVGGFQVGAVRNLEMLHEKIQDIPNNCTRFVRVGKISEPLPKEGFIKISFVCKVNGEKAGSLQEILQEFSNRGVNLTRIESRPTGVKMGEYYFFIDVVDDAKSDGWREALKIIESGSLWFKNLGVFPLKEE